MLAGFPSLSVVSILQNLIISFSGIMDQDFELFKLLPYIYIQNFKRIRSH